MKNYLAALLRKWAQRLDPVKPAPGIIDMPDTLYRAGGLMTLERKHLKMEVDLHGRYTEDDLRTAIVKNKLHGDFLPFIKDAIIISDYNVAEWFYEEDTRTTAQIELFIYMPVK